MTTNFHTPWSDGVTEYKASDMNSPLSELDTIITQVSGEAYTISGELLSFMGHTHAYSAITGRPADDDMNSLSGEAAADDADFILIWDDSASAYRKQSRANFTSGLAGGTTPYDVGVTYAGIPSSSLVILRLPLPRTVDFDWGGGVSQANAGTGATGSPVFSLQKDDVEVGTLTWSGTGGTYSGEANFVTGEVLTIVAPATPDSTLSDIGIVLAGVRS